MKNRYLAITAAALAILGSAGNSQAQTVPPRGTVDFAAMTAGLEGKERKTVSMAVRNYNSDSCQDIIAEMHDARGRVYRDRFSLAVCAKAIQIVSARRAN